MPVSGVDFCVEVGADGGEQWTSLMRIGGRCSRLGRTTLWACRWTRIRRGWSPYMGLTSAYLLRTRPRGEGAHSRSQSL